MQCGSSGALDPADRVAGFDDRSPGMRRPWDAVWPVVLCGSRAGDGHPACLIYWGSERGVGAGLAELPSGTVTCLFTHLEEKWGTAMAEHVSPEPIMQLGMAFWGSKTLLSAIELD